MDIDLKEIGNLVKQSPGLFGAEMVNMIVADPYLLFMPLGWGRLGRGVVKAFTDAKGNAVIQMTMFEHNKHQIQEVKELARELGCRQFNARRSHSDHMFIKDGDEQYEIKGWYPTGNGEHLIDNELPEMSEHFEENDQPMSDIRDSIWTKIYDQYS